MARSRPLTPEARRQRVLDYLAARGGKGATAGELLAQVGGSGTAAAMRAVLDPLVAEGLVTKAVGVIPMGYGRTRAAVIYRLAGTGQETVRGDPAHE